MNLKSTNIKLFEKITQVWDRCKKEMNLYFNWRSSRDTTADLERNLEKTQPTNDFTSLDFFQLDAVFWCSAVALHCFFWVTSTTLSSLTLYFLLKWEFDRINFPTEHVLFVYKLWDTFESSWVFPSFLWQKESTTNIQWLFRE